MGTLIFPAGPSFPRPLVCPHNRQLAALLQVPVNLFVSTNVSSNTGLMLYLFSQSSGRVLAVIERIFEAKFFDFIQGKIKKRALLTTK